MTMDKSLQLRAGLVRSRSVLTRGERIARLHVKKDGQSTDYAVIDSGLPQRIAHARGGRSYLVQVIIVRME